MQSNGLPPFGSNPNMPGLPPFQFQQFPQNPGAPNLSPPGIPNLPPPMMSGGLPPPPVMGYSDTNNLNSKGLPEINGLPSMGNLPPIGAGILAPPDPSQGGFLFPPPMNNSNANPSLNPPPLSPMGFPIPNQAGAPPILPSPPSSGNGIPQMNMGGITPPSINGISPPPFAGPGFQPPHLSTPPGSDSGMPPPMNMSELPPPPSMQHNNVDNNPLSTLLPTGSAIPDSHVDLQPPSMRGFQPPSMHGGILTPPPQMPVDDIQPPNLEGFQPPSIHGDIIAPPPQIHTNELLPPPQMPINNIHPPNLEGLVPPSVNEGPITPPPQLQGSDMGLPNLEGLVPPSVNEGPITPPPQLQGSDMGLPNLDGLVPPSVHGAPITPPPQLQDPGMGLPNLDGLVPPSVHGIDPPQIPGNSLPSIPINSLLNETSSLQQSSKAGNGLLPPPMGGDQPNSTSIPEILPFDGNDSIGNINDSNNYVETLPMSIFATNGPVMEDEDASVPIAPILSSMNLDSLSSVYKPKKKTKRFKSSAPIISSGNLDSASNYLSNQFNDHSGGIGSSGIDTVDENDMTEFLKTLSSSAIKGPVGKTSSFDPSFVSQESEAGVSTFAANEFVPPSLISPSSPPSFSSSPLESVQPVDVPIVIPSPTVDGPIENVGIELNNASSIENVNNIIGNIKSSLKFDFSGKSGSKKDGLIIQKIMYSPTSHQTADGSSIADPDVRLPSCAPNAMKADIDLMPPENSTSIFGFTGPIVRANILSAAKGAICAIPGEITQFDSRPPPFYHPFISRVITLPPFTPQQPATVMQYDPGQGTIQDCIDNLVPYSVLVLPDGDFQENITINKSIFLRSSGNTTISSKNGAALGIQAPEVFIENVNFSSFGVVQSSFIKNAACIFKGCNFTGGGNALTIGGSSYCTFDHCSFSKCANGINISSTSSVSIYSSTFNEINQTGLTITDASVMHIEACVFTEMAKAIYISGQAVLSAIRLVISNCRDSGIVYSSGKVDIYVGDCEIKKCSKFGVVLMKKARGTLANTKISECGNGCIQLNAESRLITFNNTYSGGSIASVFLLDHANLYSNGDSFTGDSLRAVAVSSANLKARKAVFKNLKNYGIIVENSTCQLIDCIFDTVGKVAIKATKTKIEILASKFSNVNEFMVSLMNVDEGCIKNCTFNNCMSVPLLLNSVGNQFEIADCDIERSKADGIQMKDSSPHFTDINIKQAGQDAVLVFENSSPVFEFSEFSENSNFGVDICNGAEAIFINCIFNDNRRLGLLAQGQCKCNNCTFTDNKTAGCHVDTNESEFVLCNFNKNNTNMIIKGHGASASLKYCTIKESQGTPAITVENDATIKCMNTTFADNKIAHLFVAGNSTLVADQCVFEKSDETPSGLQIIGSNATITGGEIQHVAKQGLIIEDARFSAEYFNIKHCDIGIKATKSNISLESCDISENGEGIKVLETDMSLKNCSVTGNTIFGIFYDKSSRFNNNYTSFSANKTDIYGN